MPPGLSRNWSRSSTSAAGAVQARQEEVGDVEYAAVGSRRARDPGHHARPSRYRTCDKTLQKRGHMLELLSKHWWVFVVRGVLAILFGLGTFLVPGVTLA